MKWLHKPKLQLRKSQPWTGKIQGKSLLHNSTLQYLIHTCTQGPLTFQAQVTFEEGIVSILTIWDFTQIFYAYAESLESVISTLMVSFANPDVDEGVADVTEIEQELDKCMRMLEELMDWWPFLINGVLVCHNPNDVQEWEKWAALWADNDDKVWFVSLIHMKLVAQLSKLKVAETYIKVI